MDSTNRIVMGACLALGTLLAPATCAQDISGRVEAQAAKCRATLEKLTGSEFVTGERNNVLNLAKEVDAHLQGKRPLVALESLAHVCASASALGAAAEGWGSSGKGSDALEQEWNEAGKVLEAEKRKFPTRVSAGQPAFLRAVAEMSMGQVDENYAAALAYGQQAGLEFGAYYLGRALGSSSFALFAASLKSETRQAPVKLAALAGQIDVMDKQIVTAYAKPGSTKFHTNFIIANSSLKLARELDQAGYRFGAVTALLRAAFALGQTTLTEVPVTDLERLRGRAEEWSNRLQKEPVDTSIAEQYLQKAQVALDAGRSEGDQGNQQRQRAALLLDVVLPRYFEIVEGKK